MTRPATAKPRSRKPPREKSAPASAKKPESASAELREPAELVGRYQLAVYSFLKARLARPSDAEDLTQEVFLRFFTSGERFDASRQVRPYLLGIARNLLRERARTLRKRNEVSWTELCVELEDLSPEAADDGRQEAMLRALPHCLEQLGDSARRSVQMHYKRRMKLKEIGRVLGRTVGAVKLLMFRARKALKKCLDERLDGVSNGKP